MNSESHAPSSDASKTGGGRDVIVIGGSSGSFPPLRAILHALPKDLPASIFIALHLAVSGRPSTEIVQESSPLPVVSPRDGEVWKERTLYVSRANEHLLFDAGGVLRVLHGPRENGARPSIDALFRSAAVHFGPRVVGVLLSGHLFDGAAGLAAIERCGGVTIVQDPSDAIEAELPVTALSISRVDHCLPAAEIGKRLDELVRSARGSDVSVPQELQAEARLAIAAGSGPTPLATIGKSVSLSCPACDGPLFELSHPGAANFRCEVGHAYNPDALLVEQARSVESALWIALRTLQERAFLLERMAEEARRRGFPATADGYEERRQELKDHVRTIREAINVATNDVPPIAAPPVGD